MNTVEKIAAGLVAVAIVNIVFFSKNSSTVIGSVFGGTTSLFGTLTTNKS